MRLRPVKTLLILGVLFVLFLATQVPKEERQKATNSNQTTATKQRDMPTQVSVKDGVAVLEYLYHTAMDEANVQCKAKKAKQRTFVHCYKARLLKDSYWELQMQKGLRLYALNDVAIHIVKKHPYKELAMDKRRISPKVMQAVEAFFEKQ